MSTQGNRLRELRKARGLTQGQLAVQSGLDRVKITKIETGLRRISGTDALFLTDALGVPTEDLLGAARTGISRYRRGSAEMSADAQRTMAWVEEYVDDALFLERVAARHEGH